VLIKETGCRCQYQFLNKNLLIFLKRYGHSAELKNKTMDKKRVLTKLEKVKEISSPPTILSEVLNLVNKQDASNRDLTEVVLKDPSLTARLLRIANSSFYGLTMDITSVNQAIMVMGFNAVKYYILSISVFNQVSTQKDKNDPIQKQLWMHFLEAATAAKKIAEHINYEIPEEAYVAGLLHDMGMIILVKNFPREYKQVVENIAKGKSICEAEKEVFGIDHQEVADFVTRRWKMPEKLCEPLRNHHFDDAENIESISELCKVVGLADSIAQIPFNELNNLYSAEKRLMTLNSLAEDLGINSKSLIEIHMKLPGEAVMSANAMELDMGSAVEILTQSNTQLFNIYLELSSLFRERQELSKKLLVEERMEGSFESLKISLATLSHYINNATMNIHGKCEIVQMFLSNKDDKSLVKTLPSALTSILKSVKKISLILEELSTISSMENLNFFNHSKAIDIEKSIKEKLASQFEKVEAG